MPDRADDQLRAGSTATGSAEHGGDPDYRATIDELLLLADAGHRRLDARLYAGELPPLSLGHLREGALAGDLAFLARLAAGTDRADGERVLRAIGAVLDLLFRPAGVEEAAPVPAPFWATPLGKLLSLARLNA